MPQPEHQVRCLEPIIKVGGDERLAFEIDGQPKSVTLKIGQMNRKLVAALPDRALDLIEIAALVYAVDAAVSRGGLKDQQMGAKWHRRFLVELPVLDMALWSNPETKQALEETLMFLSGDRFVFKFLRRSEGRGEQTRFFDFGSQDSWEPDAIMMFSGGLDSFAGALEEIIERNNRVALISHFSATKIAPIQRDLHEAIQHKLGPEKSMHFPMRVQLRGGTNSEGTHRTRSFLFAALGAVTAISFGKDRVSFYENGVVSLNLPPVGNVLGTRATRTTHPQTLAKFSNLFSLIFSSSFKVDNPFFWRTKKDVVKTISRLEMADQIANTRSCADVHNQTTQYAHCGRCSQCIDRRFAILSAGLERHDPAEAYRLELMEGERTRVQDKEAALSYVRNAARFEVMSATDLEREFPAIATAVSHLDEPVEAALPRLAGLLKRHGKSVADVMRKALDGRSAENWPDGSLPNLFGDLQRGQVLSDPNVEHSRVPIEVEKLNLALDRTRSILRINDRIEVRGKSYELLRHLADEHLRNLSLGVHPFDHETLTAGALCGALNLETEEAVRRRVMNTRNLLARKFASAGLDPEQGRELIENLPWLGYRLVPDRVVVLMKSD